MRSKSPKSGQRPRSARRPEPAGRLRNIALTLEYDGSAFFGFQKQSRHVTVQETLEAALSRLLNSPVKIASASGRTDSGVHAEGQVVNFHTLNPLPLRDIQRGLNALLPRQAAVKAIREVPEDFHARFSARAKIYEYRIWNRPERSPLRQAWTWHVPFRLDWEAMKKAAALLEGRHDFRAFCAADPARPEGRADTVRTLYSIRLSRRGGLLRMRFEGDGFLYRMVRNIAGTLVETGAGRLNPGDVAGILKSRDRQKAGKTAPAQGLVLLKVQYGGKGRAARKKAV